MSENRVVIYSNGIADFQRAYRVQPEASLKISIPVRQDHLADVLASFNVYGDVTLDAPPTFRPSNELEGNITINAERVIEDLATSLSGARVRVDRAGGKIEGTLVGLHQEEEATSGEPIHPRSVIVIADDGLKRCPLRDIQNLVFLDEDVRSEIDKALQRNYQRIKPNSTFVELAVSTAGEESDAVVQYAIPAAAWKISYRLRVSDDGPTELQGFAIVDNNTEEDWNDFGVCVVTGEPITFSTDLAETKTPARKHVNLVSATAQGTVVVAAADADEHMLAEFGAAADEEPNIAYSKVTRGGRADAGDLMTRERHRRARAARVESADVREFGDFCMFESKSPVTIPAKRSTAIPVFDTALGETRSVLHYRVDSHPERPFRAIEFRNDTGFSLGRGVCTVLEEGAYGGSCVIPAIKQGETRLLAHALETGVVIRRDEKEERHKDVAITLADGVCYTSTARSQTTDYLITSNRDQVFELYLDHVTQLRDPECEAVISGSDSQDEPLSVHASLTDGLRFCTSLPPRASRRIRVVETRLDKSRVQLVDLGRTKDEVKIEWLKVNLAATNGPLANDPGVLQCLSIHRERDAIREKVAELIGETEQLASRQERLRKNIKSGGQDELTSRWRAELDDAERRIQKLEEQDIPELRQQEKEILSRLREAVRSLAVEWKDESGAALDG